MSQGGNLTIGTPNVVPDLASVRGHYAVGSSACVMQAVRDSGSSTGEETRQLGAAGGAPSAPWGKGTVLVVQDEAEVCALVPRTLGDSCNTVLEAARGQEIL
jgi:hypothetical protein